MRNATTDYLNGFGISKAEQAHAEALIAQFDAALKDRAMRTVLDNLANDGIALITTFADRHAPLLRQHFGPDPDSDLVMGLLGWVLGRIEANKPRGEAREEAIGRQLLVVAFIAPWSAAHTVRLQAAQETHGRRPS